jgi:hypothetical protein
MIERAVEFRRRKVVDRKAARAAFLSTDLDPVDSLLAGLLSAKAERLAVRLAVAFAPTSAAGL